MLYTSRPSAIAIRQSRQSQLIVPLEMVCMKFKYKKMVYRFMAAGMLLTMSWGCAHPKVATDLEKYINQGILKIAPLETQALADYAAVVGANYTNDQAVYEALRYQVIPLYDQFLFALKEIKPQSQDVVQLHGVYRRGAETMLRGFEAKLLGLETGSVSLILEGNAAIEKGRIQTERWRTRLFALFRKYDVLHKKNNNT